MESSPPADAAETVPASKANLGMAFDPQAFLSHLLARFKHLEQHSTILLPYSSYLYLTDLYEPTTAQMPRLRALETREEAKAILEQTLSIVEAYITHASGAHDAARAQLQRLASAYPQRWEIPICLGFLEVLEGRYDDAQQRFANFLLESPGNRAAYRGLGTLFELKGEIAPAYAAWMQCYELEPLRFTPYIGTGKAVRVLLLESPMAGNLLYSCFLHNTTFALTSICPEHITTKNLFLQYDVIFNTIGDVDLCKQSLEIASHALEEAKKPIINHPREVLHTSRIEISQRLQALEDVECAKMLEVDRGTLLEPNASVMMENLGYHYPYLLRSPGFANGQFFEMVKSDRQLRHVAESLPRQTFIAMNYIPTQRADTTIRKYRVVRYNGVLYPIHLAVSYHWKIHYYSSEMFEHPEFRAEEQLFLEDMEGVLGKRVQNALHAIFDMLSLDYAGIDFTIGPKGQLVVFEANATMALHNPPLDAMWEYRRAPILRAQHAAAALVKARAFAAYSTFPN